MVRDGHTDPAMLVPEPLPSRSFSRRGARGTTIEPSVARAADVATATVTNHFATPELLLQAVVDRLMADIRLPEASIFAGTRSVPARLRR